MNKTTKYNWYLALLGFLILIGWLLWVSYLFRDFNSKPEVIDLLTTPSQTYITAPLMLIYIPTYKTTTRIITAYSSTVAQCDSTPFITASGTQVRDGVVACNFLAFGTKIRLPEMYGNKIFVVEDRTHPRNGHKIDIWYSDERTAIDFGVKVLEVEILGS